MRLVCILLVGVRALQRPAVRQRGHGGAVVVRGAPVPAPENEDWPAFPVFDPRGDELPFPCPFDESPTNYQFSRAAHTRLVDAALAMPTPQFFHLVRRGPDDGLDGSVGVVCLVVRVAEADDEDAGGGGGGDEETSRLVTVRSAGRGVVVGDAVSTFPFATARVAPLVDAAVVELGEDDDGVASAAEEVALERRCFKRIRSVAELSSGLESRGPFADAAEERLADFDAELAEWAEAALEHYGEWSEAERRERAGFALCALTNLAPAAAAECLATTDGAARFRVLDAFLADTERDLAARSALDAALGDVAPTAPTCRPGSRVSFFWHEDDGWFEATVVERVAPGFYSVRWDSDGSESRIQLDDTNVSRWKLLPGKARGARDDA